MNHKIKAVILPREHGSYGLTFEPLTLALLASFSSSGLLLFFGAAAAFFAHPPARLLLSRQNNNHYALPFFMLYGGLSAVLMSFYVYQTDWPLFAPLLSALVLMTLYLILEALSLGRKLYTEVMASVAVGLIALSIVLSGGWGWSQSLAFLILLYLRSVATTLYVHHRLLLEKKQLSSVAKAMFWQILSAVMALVLWQSGSIPFLAMTAVFILSIRAVWGLSSKRKRATVRKIGMMEFAYGLLFVLLSAVGYWSGL